MSSGKKIAFPVMSRGTGRLGCMTYELPWIRLLKSLGSWADVGEVPGGIEVNFASSTRELTPDDDMTPEPGGQWVVTDDDGNVRSRFADWRDDEP